MIDVKQIAILAGMPRAATTFLYHNLNLHPEIFIPYRRKTNYFSLHTDKDVDWYLSHFKNSSTYKIAVDTETLSFINSELNAPTSIKKINENAKIILCIREPADWVLSLYNQISTFDTKIPGFKEFLEGSYTLIEDGVGIKFNMKDGDISSRVREYENLFGDSILILKFTDVTSNPLDSLKRLEKFLGVSPFFNSENIITKKINSGRRKHNKLLNSFLRNKYLISILKNLLPRKVILSVRWFFDGLLSSKETASISNSVDNQNLILAQEHFKTDIQKLKSYV